MVTEASILDKVVETDFSDYVRAVVLNYSAKG